MKYETPKETLRRAWHEQARALWAAKKKQLAEESPADRAARIRRFEDEVEISLRAERGLP